MSQVNEAMDPSKAIEDWDNFDQPLAPLNDLQRNSILELTNLCTNKLLLSPSKTIQFESLSLESAETRKGEVDESILESFASLKRGEKKIDSTQQFYQWYSELEWEMLQEEDSEFRLYLSQLEQHQEDCRQLLNQVSGTLGKLSKLSDQYGFVSNKTNSLHEACEQMLTDQTKLTNLADDLEDRVSYFLEFEKIQSQLRSPTLSVHGELFRNILDRLDRCIGYMQSHPHYKESSVYLTKYRMSLNSALSLIRSWVQQALEQCVQQAKHQSDQGAPTAAESYAFTLLYGKFRLHADKMKQLMTDIERRREIGPDDDETSLTFLHSCNIVRYTRDYLEQLCSLLYDILRPHIIHINHLETMAELCFILRVEMIDEHVNSNPEQLAAFNRIITQLLADVQERLVYRAHIYVQNDILGYKPVSGDLAYPEKLELMESIAETLQNQSYSRSLIRADSVSSVSSQDTVRSHTGSSPGDVYGMWYPPLRRALLCLSKLYRSVDRSTFQGLSQEVLAAACASLASAAAQIMSTKTTLDAHLFHIKHLLILREQIAPFQVDFAVKEMSLDFSSVKTAALGLFQKKSRIFSLSTSNALLEFLLEGAPQIREHLKDSRRLADRQLKSTCEAFIDYCGDFLVGPIRVFIFKADYYLKNHSSESGVSVGLKEQSFGQPETVKNYSMETQKYLRTRLPVVQRSLQLYLANRETEFILFKPVKNLIVASFQQLQQLLVSHYSEEEQALIAAPTPEQISILLSAMLLKRSNSGSSFNKYGHDCLPLRFVGV
nr:EOG090X02EM [Sida crystallina]